MSRAQAEREQGSSGARIEEPIAPARAGAAPHPSLLRYSPAMILLAAAIADSFRMADPDLWGHIRFGQMFLGSGHLLAINPFSYSAPGHPWLHHEWMAQAMMAWLYGHVGVLGLKLLKFACSAGAMVFVAMALAETGAAVVAQLLILLLTAIALMLGMQMRPQMFDFLAFSVLAWTFARDNFSRARGSRAAPALWLWIPIFALWSNLHGGFFLGLAAVAVYALAAGAQDLYARGEAARAVRLAAFASTALLATWLNPFALETWKTIALTLRDPITAKVMADFRPLLVRVRYNFPDIAGLYAAYGLALILGFAILTVTVRAAGDFAMAAVAALMSAAAFAATRNVSFAAIAIAPVIARRIGLRAARRIGTASTPAPRAWGREAMPALLAVVLMATGGLFSPRLRDAIPAPGGALAFIREHQLSGNILNEFVWGQYLIWHCSPRCRIFIDGRFDLAYPVPVIEDYVSFQNGGGGAAKVLASYPHDYVLIRSKGRAYQFMSGESGWKLIYRDPTAALFARAGSSAARIPPAIEAGPLTSSYFP